MLSLITCNIVVNEKCDDNRIVGLVATVSDVFMLAFVGDAECLKEIKVHIKIITLLVRQIMECGYFITEYTKQKGLLSVAIDFVMSTTDHHI